MEETTSSASAGTAPVENSGGSTLESTEDIADTLMGGDSSYDEGDDDGEYDGNDETPDGDDADVDDGEEKGDTPEAEESPDYPVPEGMNPEAWKTIPKGLQEWMTAREHQHAEAIARTQAEISEATADRDRWLGQAKSQIDEAVGLMQALIQGEFAGIDWNAIGQSDPATAYQLRAAFDKRMAAVQQVKAQVDAAAQAHREQAAREMDRSMSVELNQVLPSLKAMMGADFRPAEFARDAAAWLSHYGFPKEAINGIRTGRELTLIAKAMQYDRIMANRAAASRKVKDAPVVTTGTNKTPADNGTAANLRKAKSILQRDSKSTASIAEALLNL